MCANLEIFTPNDSEVYLIIYYYYFIYYIIICLQIQHPPAADGRSLELSGHVGFDSLPDQLVNKSVAQGFAFNILCIGEETLHTYFNLKKNK